MEIQKLFVLFLSFVMLHDPVNMRKLQIQFNFSSEFKISFRSEKGQLYCDFKYAPFSRENRKTIGENEEKLMANNIKAALESTVCLHEFPNFQIDVFVLVLEDDGSVLSTSIMACGMAFMDGGIPCYDIITSSSVAIVNGQLLIDPSGHEEEEIKNSTESDMANYGTVTISTLSAMEQISQIAFSGYVDASLIQSSRKHILEMNKSNVNYLKKIISMKIAQDTNET